MCEKMRRKTVKKLSIPFFILCRKAFFDNSLAMKFSRENLTIEIPLNAFRWSKGNKKIAEGNLSLLNKECQKCHIKEYCRFRLFKS